MKISDNLLCLYSARVSEQEDTYTIEVPKREIEYGTIQSEKTYRVALLSHLIDDSDTIDETKSTNSIESASPKSSRDAPQQPPVSEGETREVEIESLGDQGDGIAKVERGYVVIVPDTEVGERVTVRLENVQKNVGFAEVVKRYHETPT
jgi:predicted RNA-binding protein with TRAM domain